LPRAVALAERAEDPEGGHQRSAANVRDLAGRLDRRAVAVAGQPEEPDQAEIVHIVAGAVAEGAVLAVAGDRAVHEPGVLLPEPLVAHPETLEDARAERLQQDVVIADQPQQDLASALLLQ